MLYINNALRCFSTDYIDFVQTYIAMTDFGVSKVLHDLSDKEKIKVIKFIKDEMGVTIESDLLALEESDFTKNNILKPIKARILVKYFKEG